MCKVHPTESQGGSWAGFIKNAGAKLGRSKLFTGSYRLVMLIMMMFFLSRPLTAPCMKGWS